MGKRKSSPSSGTIRRTPNRSLHSMSGLRSIYTLSLKNIKVIFRKLLEREKVGMWKGTCEFPL